MTPALGLLPLWIALGIVRQDRAPCPTPPPPPTEQVAVSTRVEHRDGTLRVSVCLASPAHRRIGSYHGILAWNAATPLLAVDTPAGRLHAENTTAAGVVDFAGVAPAGMASDLLVTVILGSASRVDLGRATLRLLELNDAAGASLLGDARVDSMVDEEVDEPSGRGRCGRRARVGRPQLERVSPASVDRAAQSVTLELLGCGFDSTNVVIVGARRIPGVPATAAGTRLRVMVPLAEAGGGEVAPMPARAGPRTIVVANAHGRSNALALVVR